MAKWQTLPISSFLKERKTRFKPDEANKLGLKRLEKIDFSGNIHINENKPTKTGMILVKNNDLVISGINVEKGAIAVYEGDEDLIATIHYSSYEFNKDKIDIEYLKYFLRSQAFCEVINSQIRGGIKTEIKPNKFLSFEIKLPDLDTQIKIRNKLNSVSDEINGMKFVNHKNITYVERLRQSVLQEAIQGKLVPQNPNDEPASFILKKIKKEKERLSTDTKNRKRRKLTPIEIKDMPFNIPKSWEWVRLEQLSKLITDGTHHSPKIQYKNKKEDTYKYVTSKNIKEEGVILDDITYIDKKIHREIYNRCPVELNDQLLIKDGAMTGVACLNNLDEEFSLLSSVALIKLFKEFTEPKYVNYFLRSPFAQDLMIGKMKGVGIPRITLTKIYPLLIPLPPLNEQKRIVKKIDQLMELTNKLKEQVKENQKNSELLMDSVLSESFENS